MWNLTVATPYLYKNNNDKKRKTTQSRGKNQSFVRDGTKKPYSRCVSDWEAGNHVRCY